MVRVHALRVYALETMSPKHLPLGGLTAELRADAA